MRAPDLTAALRTLARRPGFSLVVILLLALGAGANTAVLSIVRSVLLRPLPYADPDSLAAVWPEGFLAPEDMVYLTSRARGLGVFAGVSPGWMMALVDSEGPIKITVDRASDNFFAVLGVRASLGRVLRAGDATAGRQKVAVLSDRFWRARYGGRADAIGRIVRIDEEPYEIVGVLPRGAAVQQADTDVWIPHPIAEGMPTYRQPMQVIARLAAGASIEQVDADVRALVPSMREDLKRPADYGQTIRVVSLQEAVVGPVRSTLLLLLAAVGLVVLIAAVNHATLMLSRSVERARELAVRTALGAGRWSVARLVLVEHLTLAVLGAAVGAALAYASLPWLVRQLPPEVPRLEEIGIDVTVLAVVLGASTLLTVLFSILPMLMAARPEASTLLGQMRSGDSRREHRALNVLVAAQIALAVTLGIGAGLMLRSLWLLQRVEPGFDVDRVLTLRLQSTARHKSIATGLPYVREVLERLSALPGVTAVGAIQHLPLSSYSWTMPFEVPGATHDPNGARPRAGWRFVERDYVRAMGMSLRVGRTFDANVDRTDTQPVAMINETLARQHFGCSEAAPPNAEEQPGRLRFAAGQSLFAPLRGAGHLLRPSKGLASFHDEGSLRRCLETAIGRELVMRNVTGPGSIRAVVVGVVSDVHHESLRTAPMPEIYRPLAQVFMMTMAVVVRTDASPGTLARAAREAVWAIDPSIPVADVQPLDAWLQDSLGRPRLVARLLLVFAVTGLALGVIGVYGVAAYRVRRRQREIGVRMALGAAPAQVSAMVLRQALLQAALGLIVGLPAAWGLARLLHSQLFEVRPGDPLTFASLPAIVIIVALLACVLPARRAVRTDPVSAIRED